MVFYVSGKKSVAHCHTYSRNAVHLPGPFGYLPKSLAPADCGDMAAEGVSVYPRLGNLPVSACALKKTQITYLGNFNALMIAVM